MRIVTFGAGSNQMNPEHQRKVVDQLLMHLGVEVVHIKDEIYVVRECKKEATEWKPGKVLTPKQARTQQASARTDEGEKNGRKKRK